MQPPFPPRDAFLLPEGLLSGALLFLVLILSFPLADAIGITPSAIEADNLLRGSRFERSVQLSGLAPGQLVTLHPTGEAASWITTSQGMSFLFPDQQTLTLSLIIAVPAQTPNGRYEASVRFTTAPFADDEKGEGKASVAVKEGVLLKVAITVIGQQVEEYTVSSIAIPAAEVGKPIFLSYTVQNTGNVLAKPSSIVIDIYDGHDLYHLDRLSATPEKGVTPYESDRLHALIDHDLPVGQYWGHVTITTPGRDWQERVVFDVVPAGSLSTNIVFTSLLAPAKTGSDGLVKLEATLINTGKLATDATLVIEINTEDTLLTVLKSEPAVIAPQETATLILYYAPPGPGSYRAEGYLHYAGKRTQPLTASFIVTSENHLTGLAIADAERQATAGRPGRRGTLLNLSLLILALASILVSVRAVIRRRRFARDQRP